MYIQGSPAEIGPKTLELYRPRMTALVVFVIAQQYSAATFVSSRVPTRKEKLGVRLKMLLFKFYLYIYIYIIS